MAGLGGHSDECFPLYNVSRPLGPQNADNTTSTSFLKQLSQAFYFMLHSAHQQQGGGMHLKFFRVGVEMTLLTTLGYIYFQPCQLALWHLVVNNEPHSSWKDDSSPVRAN